MLCEYAFNENNELVHIDDVDNGLSCNCVCPCCGEKMIAKNGGKIKDHHFAHSSGTDCIGYKETLLHIWSKQIIEEYKTFTIPQYKSVSKQILIKSKKINFDSVEIEQRNDTKLFQPDIVGVTKDNIAIECQGIQHFVPIKYFGGEEKLNRQLKYDKIKKELCKEHNIEILYFCEKRYKFENVFNDIENLKEKLSLYGWYFK